MWKRKFEENVIHRQQQQDNNSRSGIGVVDGVVDDVGGGVVDGVVDAGGVDVGIGGVKSASAVKAKAELLREKHLIGKYLGLNDRHLTVRLY